MSTTAVVTMIVICGIVWGGFVFLLFKALRSEGAKNAAKNSLKQHGG